MTSHATPAVVVLWEAKGKEMGCATWTRPSASPPPRCSSLLVQPTTEQTLSGPYHRP